MIVFDHNGGVELVAAPVHFRPRKGDVMSRQINNQLTHQIGFILDHLQNESEYLDVVIECSMKMKEILSRIRTRSVSGKGSQEEANRGGSIGSDTKSQAPETEAPTASGLPEADPIQELNCLRESLLRQFLPVLEGRRQLATVREELDPMLEGRPTVSMLSKRLDEPARSDLIRLKRDILNKINEVRSINIGNQAVLIYSINFYDRLLSGLSGESVSAPCYSANGEIQKSWGGGLLKTDC